MNGLESQLFVKEELSRAKRELFIVSNVRELKMIQDRITFLSRQLKTINGRGK